MPRSLIAALAVITLVPASAFACEAHRQQNAAKPKTAPIQLAQAKPLAKVTAGQRIKPSPKKLAR